MFLNLTLHRDDPDDARDTDAPMLVNMALVRMAKRTTDYVTRLTFADGSTLDIEESMVDVARALGVEDFPVTKSVDRIVIDHDPDPDMSWLDQNCYDPDHPSFEGTYRTAPDDSVGTEYDPHRYRNKKNHVALMMSAHDEDGLVVDCLGGIDFLVDSGDWRTSTFTRLAQLDGCPYLRELAEEMGLR